MILWSAEIELVKERSSEESSDCGVRWCARQIVRSIFMGQSSKKKKKGVGKRSKGRTPSKDKASHSDDANELLAEEITALCAIFQDDCKVIDAPPKIIIKLRPYSKDMGFDDLDVSALLFVRCLPGYPYKCPKLQIIPERGLSEADANNLVSLLHELANSNAREGRVMIFNLVEAAQEFLSEIVPISQAHKSVPCLTSDGGGPSFQKDITASLNKGGPSRGPFVYGFVDLFGNFGEPWHWGLRMDQNSEKNSSLQSHASGLSKIGDELPKMKLDKGPKLTMQDKKQASLLLPTVTLEKLDEGNDEDDESTSTSSKEIMEKFTGIGFAGDEDAAIEDHVLDDDEEENDQDNNVDKSSGDDDDDDDQDYDHDDSDLVSSASMTRHQAPQTIKKDLILVHLLRLACNSKGPLPDALPQIAVELYNLGVLSDWVRDLALRPSSQFKKTFDHAFQQHMTSSKISQFWNPTADIVQPSTSLPNSRYLNDFEELHSLGHGGFGHVVLCKNKLDGRQYAVKKIRLKDKSLPLNDRILREVATLSRLQHQHVVRYYQAWIETGVASFYGDSAWGSMTAASTTDRNTGSIDVYGQASEAESTYLYIQMEYCPRTLRQVFESYQFDKELAWHLFREIVEGLAHIHGQGIIHRDLTPNNIFFDARNDIKIGDFGLAKFLKFEQLDQDPSSLTETTGVSVDGTGQVGTYFYTAPEIEQGWPKIDEKADMYSLGIMFFELWHPFGTAMERHIILSDLKQKGNLPPPWVAEFPEQASLLQRLMSPSPSDRPSATELLQHAFPPRMEYELLDNILRTMRNSEDTSVYDKVVNAIFEEEASRTKDQHRHMDGENHDHYIQYPELDTELRDHIMDFSREVFRKHCGKHLEIIPMWLLDDSSQFSRNSVKLLTHGGDMLELCHELRLPFVKWAVAQQKSSFKRYEISYVHRRAVGHSPPSHYLQGDFDIIGGTSALTEAEIIKVTRDIITHFISYESCVIFLNHGDLLEAIWLWVGIKAEHRHKVAELLSLMGSLRPQSSEWKSKWAVIRRQLLQELKLAEAIVNRLQTVGLRFCGAADQTLPRLRGALPADKPSRMALDELSDLVSYLRVWRIEEHVYINALMPPSESYHRDIFFQVHLIHENHPGSLSEGVLLAVGGCYDYLLHQLWEHEHKTNPPGAVGVSLALETMIQHSSIEIKPFRNETGTSVLICSRGGGGRLTERMELVSELWESNIKAEFVPVPDPSLTEQYEFANEHDIKCLVIITDTSVSQTASVKVRHIELKKEKEVDREHLTKFLEDAMSTQFRNPNIWL